MQAQKELVIYRGTKMRRIVLPQEKTYVFVTTDKKKIQGEIMLLLDSAIMVNNDTLYLHEIKNIVNKLINNDKP